MSAQVADRHSRDRELYSNETEANEKRTQHLGSNSEERDSGIEWQNLIFLPFDTFFASVVILSVVVVTFLVIYKVAYSADSTMHISESYIIPICDVIYLADVVLKVGHNLWTKVRETREYLPTNWFLLIIDAISLIPFNLIYEVWDMSEDEEMYHVFLSMKLLRIYRLPLNFLHLRYAIGARNLWHLMASYVTIYLVFGHILAALLHTMACWGCEEINWTKSFPPDILDSSETLNQFLAAVTVTLSLNWNNARGNISATIGREWCFFSIAMVTGLFMKSMFYAFLVSMFRRNMWRQLSFMLEVKSEANFVKSWGTTHYLRKQLALYHLTLLENRAAIRDRPEFFDSLPGPLQRCVKLDLHWEMLRHSQLLRNQDVAFKRALSCTVRVQYFLPGEYVFRVNRYTAKIIYIISGVLQVLTEDDAETPILSLSSGTILGEGMLLVPSKCRADVKSATHSQLHILDATSLYRLLHLYPKVAKHLHEKRNVRVVIAHNLRRLRRDLNQSDGSTKYRDGISWLKTQWLAIGGIVKSDVHPVPLDLIPIDAMRTSRYLELLTLSEKVELMSNAVCLRMNCPCILEPKSNFLNWWEKVNVFSSIIVIWLYPFYIAFTQSFPNWLLLLDTIFIILRSIDLCIQAFTAIKSPDQLMIVDTGHLLRLKMQTTSFLIDIIVTLPIELFAIGFGTDPRNRNFSGYSLSVYRVNRLLTIYRLYEYIRRIEKNFGTNVEPLRICRSLFTFAIAAYWLATAMYYLSCRVEDCGLDSWIGYYSEQETETRGQKALFQNPLIVTIYYAFNTLTSLGVTQLLPRNNWEISQLDGGILLSLIMYVYFCAELGATYIIHNEGKNIATEHLFRVTRFLTLRGNSPDIISRVRDHLCTQWEYNKFNGNVEGKLLSIVCEDLYDKIIVRSIVKTLKAVPLFYKGDAAFLDLLARKAKVFLLTKDTMIARAGLRTTAMYVLRNGHCRVVSALPSDVDRNRSNIVGPGSMILVVEFLHNTNNLADIHTITTCEIISIQHSDFWDTLNMFPEFKAQFESAIDYNYFTGKTIEKRNKDEAEEHPKLASLDETVTIFQYLTPFAKMGIFSIVRYLMLRRGINPNGKNFRKWEKFREAACLLSAIFYPKFFTSLVAYPLVRLVGYFLDIVGLIDIYLRLHVSYYNENGIYVSHPLSTAKHYLSTSFPADIVTSLPLEVFALHNAFGRDKTHLTKAWFYLTTRPLLILRIFGRFSTLKNDIQHSHKSLAYVKFMISTGVMLNALACASMLHICEFHHSQGVYRNIECTSYSWLSASAFMRYDDPLAVYAITVYYYCTFMLRCGNGVILTVKTIEMIIVMLVCTTVMPTWWLMVAQITCNKVGGDPSVTSHRQEMQSLLRYLKAEDVSPQLISLTMEEVEHRWKCSKESDWKKLFQSLPSQLHEEVAMELHGPALAKVSLFKEQDSSAARLLACQVDETCYRRGTTIIRRNEVQGNVYIVQDGLVDILAADDTLICTLGPGSVFGSFRRKIPVRHTMQMTARGHVLLFIISAEKFYNIIDHFPVIQTRLSNATVLDAEFLDSRVTTSSDDDSEEDVDLENETVSKLIFVSEKSTWYKCFNWTLCFPVSMISVYLVSTQISMQALNIQINSLIYVCDLFFFVKIYFGFHTNFVDENSGTFVANYKLTVRRYFCTRNLFWLDLLCCIPFEVLGYAFDEPAVRARLFTTLKLNRLLRLFHVFNYQAAGHRQLYMNPVTSGVFLCALNLMFVHLGVCLWIFVACREAGCRYLIPPNQESRFVTSRIEAMQLAYLYNLDLFTAVGTHNVQPTTMPEILTTIFLIFLYQVLALNLLTSLATFVHFSQYTFTNYEIQVERLYSFMESRSLSPILLQRIWEYCLQQWVRQRGAWMPSMLLSTPKFLQHQIMFDTYGYLLVESHIFHGLHEDFLFQLTARMKRCVYFPKNYIVQEGDVNHTMYFIHSGKVKVLSKPHPSVQGLGSILGVKQGVTNALPHYSDVVALTVTDVMSLHINSWKDLLFEFPSAKIILFKRISELSEYY